jgi:metal-sulfur cluster biosynthetic enzyme
MINVAITDSQYDEKMLLLQRLSLVKDPELDLNIVDLGLVYNIVINKDNKDILITMTLSTPSCPAGGFIKGNVALVVQESYPDYSVKVDIVFEPRWSGEMISEAGKQELGW